jgi:inner membrane protein
MDAITHAAAGAAVGEMILGKRLGNRALAWGALFGVLPDFDMIVRPLLDHAAILWWHRGPSHSLLAVMLASGLLARPLSRMWKREKITPVRAGACVFVAAALHVALDCLNTPGTALLWPFSPERFSLAWLHRVDVWFTAPIAIAIIRLAFLRKPKQRPQRMKTLAWGVGVSSLVLPATVAMKTSAARAVDADLAARGIDPERRMLAPTRANFLAWRAVADNGDAFWITNRGIAQLGKPQTDWIVVPKQTAQAGAHAGEREIRQLLQSTSGWWVARGHVRGVWIADVRSDEIVLPSSREDTVDLHMPMSWNFLADASRQRLVPAQPPRGNVQHDRWFPWRLVLGSHRPPGTQVRISGIPGSFPEPVAIVD